MKSVMIVDDEKPARELLKMLINWESAGYKIVSEARDGIEALELYSKYHHDLIITDIQMPLMDGLSLIKEIKRLNTLQPVIVLSCHENFNYAREVMKQGVSDYLIKDSLSSEDLYAVLGNKQYSKDSDKISRSLADTDIEEKSRSLFSVINNKTEKIEASDLQKVLGIINGQDYYFLHVLFDMNTSINMSEIYNGIYAALSTECGAVCSLAENHLVILSITNSSHSQLEMINQRFSVAQAVRVIIERSTGSMATIGISRICSDLVRIRENNLEAQHALGYRVFLGKGKILYFDMIQNNYRSLKVDLVETRIQSIKTCVQEKRHEDLTKELKHLYLVDLHGIMQYNYIQHVNALLLGLITTACTEHNIQFTSLFANGTISLEPIQNLETVEEMLSWFAEKFLLLINAMNSSSNEHYNYQIKKIVSYIKEHYCEDIGLDSVSKQFNIHKVHLARSFKENTGFSVNGYIRELRIQEAKKLLKSSDMNVSEIVYKIGFQNFQSFYTFFKKHVGVTPMEFRDM